MSRRKAAGLAALVLLVLTSAYLLTQRRKGIADPAVEAPLSPLPTGLESDPGAPEIAVPDVFAAAPVPRRKPEPRSWGTTRAVPARRPPPPAVAPVATGEVVEQPLPTWLRVGIIAAALLAFFAVSLIATKQV